MKYETIKCPKCKNVLTDKDYVARRYPNGYVRGITKYVPPTEMGKYGTWKEVGNTCSNAYFYRCSSCGANVQMAFTLKVTEVEE